MLLIGLCSLLSFIILKLLFVLQLLLFEFCIFLCGDMEISHFMDHY